MKFVQEILRYDNIGDMYLHWYNCFVYTHLKAGIKRVITDKVIINVSFVTSLLNLFELTSLLFSYVKLFFPSVKHNNGC